jgi:hypothetical protein
MQKWEYVLVARSRGWVNDYDKRKASDWSVDIVKKLVELGDEGWELVAVTARSSYLGGDHSSRESVNISYDYAGFTSDEVWVFKRPKP